MFLINNGRIEKNWKSFVVAPPEKQAPCYWSDFQQLFSPYLLFKKQLDLPPI